MSPGSTGGQGPRVSAQPWYLWSPVEASACKSPQSPLALESSRGSGARRRCCGGRRLFAVLGGGGRGIQPGLQPLVAQEPEQACGCENEAPSPHGVPAQTHSQAQSCTSWSTSPAPKGCRQRHCRRSKPGGKREGQGAGRRGPTVASTRAGMQGPGPRPRPYCCQPGRQREVWPGGPGPSLQPLLPRLKAIGVASPFESVPSSFARAKPSGEFLAGWQHCT